MKELIEDYKRKIKELETQLSSFKSNGSTNDIKKVERLTTKMFEYRSFIIDLERIQATTEIKVPTGMIYEGDKLTPQLVNRIDFTTLRTQKASLIKTIDELELANKEDEADELTGILNLIDSIQDFAVDVMGLNPIIVYDFELEEGRDSSTPEEEFARTNAEIIFQMRIEGEGLYKDDQMSREFIESIVDDHMHASLIKNLIRRDILNDLRVNPDNFDRDTNGKLTYDASMSDYGFAIEEYCREQFNKKPKEYFEIVHSGYQKELGREEIQVHGGENANIFLIKTDEGFVIDVYGQNDLIDTMAIFEDTLTADAEGVEEESGAPENFSDLEIEEYLAYWGQSQGEITSNLGYPKSHAKSDELLMEDYFFLEGRKEWYPKISRMYTPREQAIADFVRNDRDKY